LRSISHNWIFAVFWNEWQFGQCARCHTQTLFKFLTTRWTRSSISKKKENGRNRRMKKKSRRLFIEATARGKCEYEYWMWNTKLSILPQLDLC
jgi:hypothetical protein